MGLFKKQQHEQVRKPRIHEQNDSVMFRRSRTMTGSLSSSVRAAAESRADLQSERLKHHTLRKRQKHIALRLCATLIGIVGLGLLINHAIFQVKLRPIEGISPDRLAAYTKTINDYLTARPNERFSFSLREPVLTQALQKQFAEVQAVTVDVQPWLQSSVATVTLRQAVASWTIGSTKYYIDANGVAFEAYVGAEPTLRVEDKTGLDPAVSGPVASSRMIHYIGRLVSLLGVAGLTVEKLELPAATSREVDVRLAGKKYTVKTNLDRDPAGQVADIVNAVRFLDSKKLSPSYADVRVSSRLYYR